MSAAVAVQVTPRARQAKNLKFANDGSYSSVEPLIKKLTRMYFSRAESLGLAMNEDDVRSTLNVAYVKALEKWKPDGGALFVTYFHTVAMRHWNTSIERETKDKVAFGMISYDEAFSGTEEGGDDPLETYDGMDDSHEDTMIRREELQERLADLSMGSKRLIMALLMSEREASEGPAPKLRELAASAGIVGDELRQVKVEIMTKFGVRWV